MNRFKKGRSRYYTTSKSNKQYYRKLFIQTFLCILIVIIIIIIKLFNTDGTDDAIKVIKNNIEKDRSIKADGKYVLNKITDKELFKSVFNNEKDQEDKYVFPVSGTLYRDFGEISKGKDVKVFNKGIDIIAKDELVKAISEGTVVEIGQDNIYGNYIIINHGEFLAKYYGFESVTKDINSEVKKGEVIGKLKITGDKHNFRIEVYKDNEAVDPLEDLEYHNEDVLLI